jgi:hypothetical protein
VLFVDTATLPKIVAMPTSDESQILAGKKLNFDELSNTTKQRTKKQKLRSKLKKQRWKERRRMKKANNDLNHFEYSRSCFQDNDDSEEEEVRVDDDPETIDACSSANPNKSPAVTLNATPMLMPEPEIAMLPHKQDAYDPFPISNAPLLPELADPVFHNYSPKTPAVPVAMLTPDEMVNEPLKTILPLSSSSVTGPFLAGLRILVNYKGMPYKATIHKFRAKDEKKEVQIHYDGNRKTTHMWITVDNIYKFLEHNSEHGAVLQKK